MRRFFWLSLIIVFAIGPAAMAQNPLDALARANSSYMDGDYHQTMQDLREAMQAVWNLAPLEVNNVHFVSEQPEAFGMYTPRETSTFDGVEPLMLYCEPAGYTVVKDGDNYKFSLKADFTLEDQEGKVLGGQKDFGNWGSKSRSFNMEFMMFFTFNIDGLPVGNYRLNVTLNDTNSEKHTTFTKEFLVR